MSIGWVHPGLVLILGAWALPFVKGRAKRVAMLALPVAALVDCLLMTPGTYGVVRVLGQELVFGRVDSLSHAPPSSFTMWAPARIKAAALSNDCASDA